ncbi:MAG: kelch repeat-containing protein [Acidobacteriota bacterium]
MKINRNALGVAVLVLPALATASPAWVPAPAGPYRAQSRMAFDSVRNRMMLFGGDYGGATNDLWEYDGTSWTQVVANAPAPARYSHGVAFDSARNRLVIYGGYTGAAPFYLNDVWEYTPGFWTAASPIATPRASFGMAFDSARARTVIFAGYDGAQKNDTYEYDGNVYTGQPDSQHVELVMVFDSQRNVMVVFGGNPGPNNDTWEYDGGPWVYKNPATKPPARYWHAMAYDSARGRVVMFGGRTVASNYNNDTWEYDGVDWYPGATAPAGLTPRSQCAMAFDSARSRAVLEGGGAGFVTNETWEYVCGAITLAPASLPNGTPGVAYSRTITASGGSAPYTFSKASGTLPPGLALSAGGVLAGTPTTPGSFTFAVRASDAGACAGTKSYTVTIVQLIDFLVGQGLGQPNVNRVRVFTAAGTATSVDFLAYAAGQWGTVVAAGNIDGGAYDEILTGPGPGAVYGPQVRGFQRTGTAMGKVNFYAYGTLKYGVNVVSDSIDSDLYAEMITGPGPGVVFGPTVRGWNFDGATLTAIAKINFNAYVQLQYGANVSTGSFDADAFAEIATGPGPGPTFAPNVRGWNYDGATISAIANVDFNAFAVQRLGVIVGSGNVDGDAYDEIVCAPGPGAGANFPSRFVGFNVDGGAASALPGFDVTAFSTTYGGRVGLGDVSGTGGNGRDEPSREPEEIPWQARYRRRTATTALPSPCCPSRSTRSDRRPMA